MPRRPTAPWLCCCAAALLSAWGSTGGDVNDSGDTDGADLGIMLSAWGNCQQ